MLDFLWSCSGNVTKTNVYTLKGTPVEALINKKELSNRQYNKNRDFQRDNFPNVVVLEEPSNRYNCHSYAWYSQDTENNFAWILDLKNFYEDYSNEVEA